MTVAVVAVAVSVVAVGRGAIAERVASLDPPPAVAPQAVTAARVFLNDGYEIERAFTGQLEPAQRTAAGFEIGGTVAAIFVDEGDSVAAGAPLARLDTRLLEAERDRLMAARDAASAQAELAARTTERQTALQARGVASPQALDAASLAAAETTARMAEIDASLTAISIQLEKATITAPFTGRISVRHLDLGASAEPGLPVVSMVETANALFRVGLPPDAVRALSDNGAVSIEVDGGTLEGELRAVLPDLDAATRSQTALFAIKATTRPPVWRSIGVLRLTDHVLARGTWAPISALEAGPRGTWRILTIVERDGESLVGAEAVEILHATAERVFLRGALRDGDLFIADGAHRVVPGQRVRAIDSGG